MERGARKMEKLNHRRLCHWFTIKQKSTVMSELRGHRVVRLLAHTFGAQMIHCPQFYLRHALHDPGLLIRSKRKGFTLLNGLTLLPPSYFLGDLESYCFHVIFFFLSMELLRKLPLSSNFNWDYKWTWVSYDSPFFPSNIQKKMAFRKDLLPNDSSLLPTVALNFCTIDTWGYLIEPTDSSRWCFKML